MSILFLLVNTVILDIDFSGGQQAFSMKGHIISTFNFAGHVVSVAKSTLPLSSKSSCRQFINEWALLCLDVRAESIVPSGEDLSIFLSEFCL